MQNSLRSLVGLALLRCLSCPPPQTPTTEAQDTKTLTKHKRKARISSPSVPSGGSPFAAAAAACRKFSCAATNSFFEKSSNPRFTSTWQRSTEGRVARLSPQRRCQRSTKRLPRINFYKPRIWRLTRATFTVKASGASLRWCFEAGMGAGSPQQPMPACTRGCLNKGR